MGSKKKVWFQYQLPTKFKDPEKNELAINPPLKCPICGDDNIAGVFKINITRKIKSSIICKILDLK